MKLTLCFILGLALIAFAKPYIDTAAANIRRRLLRRRMIRAGQDPDRTLTRQERRHLEQRLAKQMRRAAYGSAKSHR